MTATDLAHPVLGGLPVLVVESCEESAATMTALLRMYGYDARTARTGRAALAAVDQTHPAVVLIDLDLPDAAGCDVIRQIRSRPAAPEVIVVTAHTTRTRRQEATAAGAHAVLLKPAEASELVALIQLLTVTAKS
ncbi:response regulator transcription factor [Fimbriiglobus ruber]|uniref:Putative two-component system response regulator n=1 Tax=Fimbriiglobus ruber TaxID=1908690 RepID=A0A225DPD0_9BACT|nr:response regulator [Fimbriiglobus ruber]OWK43252.1 putative two-component system response regulator [Fimbriiglobus ruber]